LIEGLNLLRSFGGRLDETLDTQLRFSSTYHPKADGQTERVNHILKDMLRALLYSMEGVGIRVCRMPSFATIIAIKRV
jgi:hypothetical protein